MAGEKNPMVAALLGVFCGCFGLFYVSIAQGFLALLVVVAVSAVTAGAAAPFIWLGCAVWGYVAAENHNKRVRSLARLDYSGALTYESGTDPYGSMRLATGAESKGPAGPGWGADSSDSGTHLAGSYCGSCGASLQAGSRYCIRCGKNVK